MSYVLRCTLRYKILLIYDIAAGRLSRGKRYNSVTIYTIHGKREDDVITAAAAAAWMSYTRGIYYYYYYGFFFHPYVVVKLYSEGI